MRTESITYEIVAMKIKELLRHGEKLTVRNVLKQTGGSTSKIMAYIKRWYTEQKSVTANRVTGLEAIAKEEIALLESNLASLTEENKLANKTINNLEQKLSDSEYKLDEILAGCHQLREELDKEKAQHKASILARTVLQTQYDQCRYRLIQLFNK